MQLDGAGRELDVDNLPYEFCCPITQDLLIDPVLAADGFTYERAAITKWLAINSSSPMTGATLPHTNVVANLSMRTIIDAWRCERDAAATSDDAASSVGST